jgi:hypothetical protein
MTFAMAEKEGQNDADTMYWALNKLAQIRSRWVVGSKAQYRAMMHPLYQP